MSQLRVPRRGTPRVRLQGQRLSRTVPWLLVLKAAIAATLAWITADDVLASASATFAPFTAVLLMQDTVSRSLDHALRFATAMLGGVLVAGVLSPLLGQKWPTFALMVLIALLIGRWRRLGGHGVQVAVAAMFTYTKLTETPGLFASWASIMDILVMVLLGCVMAVLVNLILLPPLRYRTARRSLSAVSQEAVALLREVAQRLESDASLGHDLQTWIERAETLPDSAAQARQSVDHAAESGTWNPRRLLQKPGVHFEVYRIAARGLQRISGQLRLIVTDLHQTDSGVLTVSASDTAAALSDLADIVEVLGDPDSTAELDQIDNVETRLQRSEHNSHDIAKRDTHRGPWSTEAWLSAEALHIDLHRLAHECRRIRDELANLRQLPGPQS